MWKKYLAALFASVLALALAAGLGAAIGALFMVLGGAILTSAGWSVIGTGGLLNIGLVAGAIMLPLPLLLVAYQLSQGRAEELASHSPHSLSTTGAVYGLVGAAVLGMTTGIQLGYVSAAGAIGAVVGGLAGGPALFFAASVLYMLGYGLYQLAFQMTSPRENQKLILDKEHSELSASIESKDSTKNTNQNTNTNDHSDKKETLFIQYNSSSKEVGGSIVDGSINNTSNNIENGEVKKPQNSQQQITLNLQNSKKKSQSFW